MDNPNLLFIELSYIYIIGDIPEELLETPPALGNSRTVYDFKIIQANSPVVLRDLLNHNSINKSKILVVLGDFAPFCHGTDTIRYKQELIAEVLVA